MIDIRYVEVLKADSKKVRALAEKLGCSDLLAKLLINRGIDSPEAASDYFNAADLPLHDPELYPGIPEACDLIMEALDKKQKIFICGDYDADGVCASAVLLLGLRRLNASVGCHLPHRFIEGFGLSKIGVDKACDFGASLLITVDCGSSNFDNVEYAKALGLKVIVTDHHQLESDIAEPHAFVNANLPGHSYPFDKLCGTGVAWKLLCALFKRYMLPEPEEYLDFVALATLCDMVPMRGENRTLTMRGLDVLSRLERTSFKVLTQACKISSDYINSQAVSFSLGPKLNACGRMDSPDCALDLVMTEDPGACKVKADRLLDLCEERSRVEQETLKEIDALLKAEKEEDRNVIFVCGDWHRGVIGLCSQRLMDTYRVPVFAASCRDGAVIGSARTPEGTNLLSIMSMCSEYFSQYGGHSNAGGFTVIEGKTEEFRAALKSVCRNMDFPPAFKKVDAIVPINSLNLNLVRELERLEPVGKENEKPKLLAQGVIVEGMYKAVGRLGTTISFRVSDAGFAAGRRPIKAIAFSALKDIARIDSKNCTLDIIYTVEENVWAGSSEVQIVVNDFVVRSRDVCRLMPASQEQNAPLWGYPEAAKILSDLDSLSDSFKGIFSPESLKDKIADARSVLNSELYIQRVLSELPPGECAAAVVSSKSAALKLKQRCADDRLHVFSVFETYSGLEMDGVKKYHDIIMACPPLNKKFFSEKSVQSAEKIHIVCSASVFSELKKNLHRYHLDRDIMSTVYKWAASLLKNGQSAVLSSESVKLYARSLRLDPLVLKRALTVLEQLGIIRKVNTVQYENEIFFNKINGKFDLNSSALYASASVILENFEEVCTLMDSFVLKEEDFLLSDALI